MSVLVTVYGLQLIIPEAECEELGPGAQAERWRPLQAVVAQVQVLQLSQGLGDQNKSFHKQARNKMFLVCENETNVNL